MATASAAKTLRISNQTGASNAPTVLVTDKDVDLSQLREKFQVIQFIGDGAMPRDQLKQQVANVDALYCLVRFFRFTFRIMCKFDRRSMM
uniref:Uncharacterized protein n=1 Tax=Parascaris equorum TaxID=6256 RepID=A0A914RKW1_PAREQ